MNQRLVAAAIASALFIVSTGARADGLSPLPPSQPPPASATAATSVGSAAPIATGAAPSMAVAPSTPAAADAPKRSVLPIIVMAVGGAGVVAGLGAYSFAGTKESQADSLDRGGDAVRSTGSSSSLSGKQNREDAEGIRSTGTILLAGGALVAVGGLVWFFLDRQSSAPKTKTSAFSLTPSMGPANAGATLQGTF